MLDIGVPLGLGFSVLVSVAPNMFPNWNTCPSTRRETLSVAHVLLDSTWGHLIWGSGLRFTLFLKR